MTEDSFTVLLHEKERVLEATYPARVTVAAFERYSAEMRAIIARLATTGAWHCLVDQSRITGTMPSDLPPRIAELVAWAHEHGLDRIARIVSSSELGRLQATRLLRAAGVAESAMLFHDRESAWAFVTGSKLES